MKLCTLYESQNYNIFVKFTINKNRRRFSAGERSCWRFRGECWSRLAPVYSDWLSHSPTALRTHAWRQSCDPCPIPYKEFLGSRQTPPRARRRFVEQVTCIWCPRECRGAHHRTCTSRYFRSWNKSVLKMNKKNLKQDCSFFSLTKGK